MPSPVLFVKPADGLKVRDPVSKLLLPEYGKAVPDDQFWNRRLIAKDCVLTTEAEITAGRDAAAA